MGYLAAHGLLLCIPCRTVAWLPHCCAPMRSLEHIGYGMVCTGVGPTAPLPIAILPASRPAHIRCAVFRWRCTHIGTQGEEYRLLMWIWWAIGVYAATLGAQARRACQQSFVLGACIRSWLAKVGAREQYAVMQAYEVYMSTGHGGNIRRKPAIMPPPSGRYTGLVRWLEGCQSTQRSYQAVAPPMSLAFVAAALVAESG